MGFVPTVLCAVTWLVGGAIVARTAAASLWQVPRLAQVIGFSIATIVGLGGLVAFWLIADHVDYLRRGYHVRWVAGDNWLYEERVLNGTDLCLPCIRVILGNGYPVPSEVRIPSEARWESDAPLWARGRREEITQRIARCFGGDRGAQIRFSDP